MRKTGILVVFGVALIMLSVPFVSAESVYAQYKLPNNLASIPDWLNITGNYRINDNHKLEFDQFDSNGMIFRVLNSQDLYPNIRANLWFNFTYELYPSIPKDNDYGFLSQFKIYITNNNSGLLKIPNVKGSEFNYTYIGFTFKTQYRDGITKAELESYLVGKAFDDIINTAETKPILNPPSFEVDFSKLILNISGYHDDKFVLKINLHTNMTKTSNSTWFNMEFYSNITDLNLTKSTSKMQTLRTPIHFIYKELSERTEMLFGQYYASSGLPHYEKEFNLTFPERKIIVNNFDLEIYSDTSSSSSDIRHYSSNTENPQGNTTGNYPLTYNMGIILGIVIITMVIATDIYIHKKFP